MFQLIQNPDIPKGVLVSRQSTLCVQLSCPSYIAATAAALSEIANLSYRTCIASLFTVFHRLK